MDLLGWEPLREAAEKEDGTSIAGTLYGTNSALGKERVEAVVFTGLLLAQLGSHHNETKSCTAKEV